MKQTKDSDIALMHLQHKVQYTGEFLFSQKTHLFYYAKHMRVVGNLLLDSWISWQKVGLN